MLALLISLLRDTKRRRLGMDGGFSEKFSASSERRTELPPPMLSAHGGCEGDLTCFADLPSLIRGMFDCKVPRSPIAEVSIAVSFLRQPYCSYFRQVYLQRGGSKAVSLIRISFPGSQRA